MVDNQIKDNEKDVLRGSVCWGGNGQVLLGDCRIRNGFHVPFLLVPFLILLQQFRFPQMLGRVQFQFSSIYLIL